MKRALAIAAACMAAAGHAQAASGPFFSLGNTDFIVTISFLLFIGAIVYFKAPVFAGKLIDGRIELIRRQIEEARSIREDAQSMLASAEQEQKDAEIQSELLVSGAQENAKTMIAQAKEAIDQSVARRLRAAEDQIASSEAAAVAEIRDTAVEIAVAAAADVISANLSAEDRVAATDNAIGVVDAKLN